MIIKKLNIGAYGKKTCYAICSDLTETNEVKEIARFNTLELATLVLKFMRGDELCIADEDAVREAIKKVDAQTD